MLQAHAVVRTMCSCKNFSLDPQSDHVLTCKKHTGATRGHNHVMDVLAQLARNTGYPVRVNHKVSTTAAASNKQGDIELVNFGLVGSANLVIDMLICCDHNGNSTVNNRHLNGKMHTNDYLQAKNGKYKEDYAAVGTAFAPAIVSVAGQIHPGFLRLLWVLADKQTHNYYALIGAEEEIGSEAFTWSRVHKFIFNKNSIGKAIAYATATRPHLSVHSTAPPSRCQPVQPILSAECIMLGAAHASHHATPRPAPPRPAVNVDVGAPIVAPSAHASRVGAPGEVDVADDGTHAAGDVAASEWLAANLGGGVVDTGGTDVRISANDDAQSDDDDNHEVSVLEVILGRQVDRCEDTACDQDGVDVRVGVNDDAVVGVVVYGQGVKLGVSPGVGIGVGPPPSLPSTLREPV